jgi:GNAT superfamily N-acetyltransferase
VIVRLVEAGDFVALAALFDREHSPCFCRFWHFAGTNKEWEARCGLSPEVNRTELEASLRSGETRGMIALEGDRAIGWMKLHPRAELIKLTARSPYKELDRIPDVWSIGCFLIDSLHRRQGVARALLEGAIAHAPSLGARALEGYPRVFDGLHDFEQWTGPIGLFEQLGFEVVRDQPQYPVLRRALQSS